MDDISGLGNLDDLLRVFGKNRAERAEETLKKASEHLDRERKKDAPKPQLRAKTIDEVRYLRAEDVLVALERGGQKDSPLARKIRDLLRR